MRFHSVKWLVFAMLSFGAVAQAADCSTVSGCALKQCEIETLIEQARKDNNMRRLATLKDLRTEALRCTDPAMEKKPTE